MRKSKIRERKIQAKEKLKTRRLWNTAVIYRELGTGFKSVYIIPSELSSESNCTLVFEIGFPRVSSQLRPGMIRGLVSKPI